MIHSQESLHNVQVFTVKAKRNNGERKHYTINVGRIAGSKAKNVLLAIR